MYATSSSNVKGIFRKKMNAGVYIVLIAQRSCQLHCVDAGSQPRFIARGGVFVQRTLLNRLIKRGNRLAVGLLGGLLVALLDGLAQRAQRGAQAGGIGAIGGSALRGLTGALKRRKMISHVWFVTFV